MKHTIYLEFVCGSYDDEKRVRFITKGILSPHFKMLKLPHHPFVDETMSPVEHHYTSICEDVILSKEVIERATFENAITPSISNKKRVESKPFKCDDKTEQRFPKIRVNLTVFQKLKQLQKEQKCKSFCEVVEKLLESYEDVNNLSVVKSE
ncbi:hypothetical protein EIN_176920 [Entamoeba invadens IP1]|uniref:hypothetical protein n=1 Tax=Entamoeba invadens IP1 TaxID=370355 RepID=UPI0002C3CE4C|nr:hypothetical protein EIN_176920 [Entamoeba invadens IP1]ELP93865.1 hypothetical protein EIN_176920 [Entamoeba invadens IP1]|eukprot:XP_004260636.1 hypothetical protein EIN_176920 [Entamoeba invadens IP1]